MKYVDNKSGAGQASQMCFYPIDLVWSVEVTFHL